ncbi:MAG: N-acetyltransferase family protein [Acidimicrobiia bacterium]
MDPVRRATPADLDELLELVEAFYEIDNHVFNQEHVCAALQPLLESDEHGQVWVLQDRATAACGGYAVITWSWSLESGGRDAILDEIYVRAREHGAGTRSLHHASSAAAEAGARVLYLETEASNERVRRFYARNGFQVDDSVWMSTDLPTGRSAPTTPNIAAPAPQPDHEQVPT